MNFSEEGSTQNACFIGKSNIMSPAEDENHEVLTLYAPKGYEFREDCLQNFEIEYSELFGPNSGSTFSRAVLCSDTGRTLILWDDGRH